MSTLIHKTIIVGFCFVFGVLSFLKLQCKAQDNINYDTLLYNNLNIDRKHTYVLNTNKPLEHQFKHSNTKYVIKDNFDLKGQTISIPDNSVLYFKGGSFENGTLVGNYIIFSAPYKIFKDVLLSGFNTHGLDFRWFVGDDRIITSNLLNILPDVPVYFGNEDYYANEIIDLSTLDYINYYDIRLYFSKSIRAFCQLIAGGFGNFTMRDYKNKCFYISPHVIGVQGLSDSDYVGKLISIRTADRTLYDWRPLSKSTNYNEKGNPTLFKGLTSITTRIEGEVVEMLDSIDVFSHSRVYSYIEGGEEFYNDSIFSSWSIYNPKHVELHNCEFIGIEKNASVFIGGKDIFIENCSFISKKGTDVIMSINNSRGGYIYKSKFEGAWAGGNSSTNYGIQINGSTAILIDSCFFRNNRRSVDFSGEFESRYCTVAHCVVIGDGNNYNAGSALGGHSTSFGNSFINNYLEGKFQAGILCRGEKELVEGNIINAFCNGAIIVSSFNTTIRNNVSHNSKWGRNYKAIYIGKDYGFKSTIIIEGNNIDIREKFLHAYDPNYTTLLVRNNTINCFVVNPSDTISIAPNGYSGEFFKNDIHIEGNKNNVIDIPYIKQ